MGIGARLMELMKKKNINTNELAIMIGVPPTTLYSMIKRDSNRSRSERLSSLTS